MTAPPPPPGFIIADPAVPAPPPGFVIGQAQPGKLQQFASYVGSGRALDDLKNAYHGDAAEQAPSAGTPGLGEGPIEAARDLAAQTFGDDFDMAKRIARIEPGAEVTQDANGNAMVQFADGRRVYANQPGLDSGDFLRLGGQLASFAPGVNVSRAIAGGSLAGRAALTGAAAGSTDLAGQATGRDDIDMGRVALTAGFGTAGELIAPAIGGAWNAAKRLLRSGASKERAALEAAKAAGIGSPTNKQISTLARGIDEIEAGADPATILGTDEFGFLYTKGQKATDRARKFSLLSKEEKLASDTGGAGQLIRNVKDANFQKLNENLSRIGDEFGGGQRLPTPAAGVERAQGIIQQQADDLQGRITDAYGKAAQSNRAAVAIESVQDIPARLKQAVSDFDMQLTPATRQNIERITGEIAALDPNTKGVTLRAIETQRRMINNSIGAAATPADKAALMRVKSAYDGWIDDAFDNALISGEPEALTAMKEARGLRAEFGKRFDGRADTDKFIGSLINGNKTAEELLNVALGASQVSKASAGRFVERVSAATGNNPEAMNALRAAHFQRLTTNKAGEPLGFQAVMNNIKATERENASIIRALYSDTQWGQIKRLAQSIDPLVPKGDFAKSSGTAERFARFFGSTPWLGKAMAAVNEPFKVWQASGITGPLRNLPKPAPAPAVASFETFGDRYAR